MKRPGVLLGSVESELSEFPPASAPRDSVEQMSSEEVRVPSSSASSVQEKVAGFVDKHNKAIKIALAVALLLIFLWFGPRALFAGVLWLTEKTRNEALWLSCLVQFLLVVFWSVLCIPFPSSIEILSGFLLGFFWGTVVNVLGLFTTCALSFLIGRRLLRSTVSAWLNTNAPRLQQTFRVIEHRGLKFLVLFRMLAIPFWSRNYGPAALLDCSFRDFAISVLIGTCPFGILYAYIGDRSREISEEISGNHTQTHWVELVVISVCLTATIYVSYSAFKIFQAAEAQEQPEPPADVERGGNAIHGAATSRT